jgi:hypothetical protein
MKSLYIVISKIEEYIVKDVYYTRDVFSGGYDLERDTDLFLIGSVVEKCPTREDAMKILGYFIENEVDDVNMKYYQIQELFVSDKVYDASGVKSFEDFLKCQEELKKSKKKMKHKRNVKK